MDKLPMNDVPMLVSAINFLLRDHEFDTLDEICNHFNVNRAAFASEILARGEPPKVIISFSSQLL